MSEKILFVDDDSNILEAYKRQMRKRFTIETALGGEEGLAVIARNGPFAVVVADMRMPRMDGIEFLMKVKTIAPHTVRMMLTGNADQQTANDAVEKGQVFHYLTKPCNPDVLTKAIDAGLSLYQLQGQIDGIRDFLASVK